MSMAKPVRWFDVVRLRARYQRSVHLERDVNEPEWLRGYIVTPLVRSLVSRIGGALGPEETARAWSLTGPYGSGKSSFALFLGHVFGVPNGKQGKVARQLLMDRDPDMARRLFGKEGLFDQHEGLWPVLATGERRSFEHVLLAALEGSANRYWNGRGAKPSILTTLKKAVAKAAQGQLVSPKDIVSFFGEVAAKVASSVMPGRGLLVVLDEAGKTLEYASQTPGKTDVMLLQELAEAAARSGDTPIVFVLTLHQSFERYASKLGAAQRNEWGKVQGRFEDVAFQEGADQQLRLVAAALDRDEIPAEAKGHTSRAAGSVASVVKLPGSMKSHEFEELLLQAVPLHPATSLLLGPLFRSRVGQNERSLFAFLATSEPKGFQDFLREAPADKKPWPLYTVDRLYDYVISAFGTRLFEQNGRQWSQLDSALQRLPPSSTDLDARLIKCIGMLTMFGEPAGLAASEKTLVACLDAQKSSYQAEVHTALERLQAASLIIYRKFRDSYQLWEGSDLDLDLLAGKALRELDQLSSVTQRITRVGHLPPIIARRHLFQTGTLRYFEVRYADEALLDEGLVIDSDDADGVVCVLLPTSAHADNAVRTRLTQPLTWAAVSAGSIPSLIILPAQSERIRQIALELAALEWVQIHTPELQGDVAARRELAARLAEAEGALRLELTTVLQGAGDGLWYFRGRNLSVSGPRELASLLSDLCDEAYSSAPAIHNEMVNRRALSSNAVSARRALIQAMLGQRGTERLGIEGCPPELSMYLSVLSESGLHAHRTGGWGFGQPSAGKRSLRPVYEAIRGALRDTATGKVKASSVYVKLRRPPFGLKDGVLPVILLSVMIEMESELAVYEDGVFIPSITPAIAERFIKSPDKFELQLFEIEGAREELFRKLQGLFERAGSDKNPALLTIVRELVRIARGLPEYSRNTRALSDRAHAVREALLRAKEPGPLIFRDLPVACGLQPFDASNKFESVAAAADMVELLRSALRELSGAYPRLLDDAEAAVFRAFSLPSGDAARPELEARSQQLMPHVVDTQVKGFLLRAASTSLGKDEWIVAVATLLGGKPPEGWNDRDADQAKLNLASIATRFLRLEAVLLGQGKSMPTLEGSALRFAITQPGEAEVESVIVVREADRRLLTAFCERLRDAIGAGGADLSRETMLAGLATVAKELMAEVNDSRTVA